ncbi:tetratricopeptide repeat protein 28-like, partial [Lingula anatina]|uniref:Tetratricopeptide repeat protein 28-like n=1 Tax=Lingula anatina TaxID=7574 RepID=A0A1S3IWF4_LINAN
APCQLLSVQLPGKLAELKGREDLVQQIQQHITGESRLVLLTGMGGIGKTSVAIEVGHREQNVLYIDMRQVTNLDSVKLSLVQHYHPTSSLKDLYSDYQNVFIQSLSSLTSDTVIIFDNNDEVIKSNLQEFHSLIQCISNSTKHVTLLCTSRESFSVMSHNMAVLDVPPLDKAPSTDILWEGKATSPTDSESIVLGELAEKCGGNPLALKLLAVQLKKKTAQRVLDRMQNKNVIENLKVANLPASQEMMACLDMSYETLNTEEQRVFRALHIFPVSFHVEEVSGILKIDEDECEYILDSLCNKSLLGADHSVYDLHPLLRAYAAFQAGTDQNEIAGIQDAYCKHYMKQTPLLLSEFETLSSKETYGKAKKTLPHLKVIASLLTDQLGNKNLHDEGMTFIQLKNLYSIARVCQNVFLYPEALTILRTLEMFEGKDFPFEQISPFIYGAIAEVLQGMGNYKEALAYQEKSLDVKQAILGEKHPLTASTYQNIGSALWSMGKFADSLTYYKQSLDIQKEIVGEKHSDTAGTYQNIGSALCAMGKYQEGLTYYYKSIEIVKETFGEKHPLAGMAYQNIGNALCEMGTFQEALPCYQKSLQIMEEILGMKHPDTAGAYQNIGSALCAMGKYQEALTYHEKSLQIIKEIFGEKHPDTGRAYHNIGTALLSIGTYAEALTYYEKSLEIIREFFGEKHPYTGTVYQNIGNALCDVGKYAEALTYYEKSLLIKKDILGEKHSDTASTYNSIGVALRNMGKFAEALTYHEKSLEIQKDLLGEKHPNTATTYRNIGSALCDMGKYPEALKYYKKALEIIKEIFGENHPDTGKAYHKIAQALYAIGKYAEALTHHKKSLQIRKEILGDKHPDTAATYQNIGNTLNAIGKYAEALTYYEKNLDIIKAIFGEEHRDTAATYQNIGNALCGMGKYAKALQHYDKSLKKIEEILGEKHPDTARAYQNFGSALYAMGKKILVRNTLILLRHTRALAMFYVTLDDNVPCHRTRAVDGWFD